MKSSPIAIPEYLIPFLADAEKHLALAPEILKDIEFSGPTYQIQIIDPLTHKEYWTFLQLDNKEVLKDSFCSCEQGESLNYCFHIALGYLSIYNGHAEPLHVRFERSLWNILCKLYAERVGIETDVLEKIAEGDYRKSSISGKTIFGMKSKTEKGTQFLTSILDDRKKETEETSLKFSNLSEEEMELWREGRPSFELSYELSFWRDIAYWLMVLQERNSPYEINFEYTNEGLPNQISLEFEDISLHFYISQANLPEIIPGLEFVKAPLKVYKSKNSISKFTYDEKTATMRIHEAEQKQIAPEKKKGIVIDHWLLMPGDGFYAQVPYTILENSILDDEMIQELLEKDFELVAAHLKDCEIHPTPVPAFYSVSFDPDWNLHITCYAFNSGDLILPHSHAFGDWVYIENEGFYHLTNKTFDGIETVVYQDEVAKFISHQRPWLNQQDGFHTHSTSLDSQYTYQLSKDNKLSFQQLLSTIGKETKSKDFGSWIYVAGRGFYPKVQANVGAAIQTNTKFNASQIPLLIHIHRDTLLQVPGFFSRSSPINSIELSIELLDDDTINVNPVYVPREKYKDVPLKFFDDYVFVEGEGFSELPTENAIPEEYHHPVHVAKEDLKLFLEFTLDLIRPFAPKIDHRLCYPENLALETSEMSKDESVGRGWYSLQLNYRSEYGIVPVSDLWTAIKKKKRFIYTEAGLIDLEDRRFHWLRLLPKTRFNLKTNDVLMPTFELLRLNAFDEIGLDKKRADQSIKISLLLKEITELKPPSEPDRTGLNCSLRPYQEVALRWLWFLYHYNLSGLLCDDMGLGKTHQTMALFAAVVNEAKASQAVEKCRFLVICPTSVLFHWQEKLKEFLPNLNVFTYYGNLRTLEGFYESDVLLTSYGIWRNDEENLKDLVFEVAVFDEIQIAKNHQSRIYSSLLNTNAKMRLGLTGTPIENHLRELKTLFDLVIPGYMPRDSEYRQLFIKPIEKESNSNKKELLSRFIKPFVLRRKKEDVLPELPEKTEEVFHCELLPDQQLLYNEVLVQSRQAILQRLEDNMEPIPFVHIFSILSSLKQICNHPATYLKTPEEYKQYNSGKWDLFVELVNEARESKQKIVVFTQYLFMLDIFEQYLNELGVGFATIRGATTHRGEQLQRFNNDPDCEIFLGSLQAAGLGVDLTAGSVVIHYDRWWNAARENQATDRVHRIGQTRGVQVFKFVTKGTFEERIDAIISRKGKLMEEVVGTDERELVKSFNREEIIELLQLVGDVKK